MGFECAIAIVIPEPDELIDFYPLSETEREDPDRDIFTQETRVHVPVRNWKVFRSVDFGRVRTLEKSSSSLRPHERAGSTYLQRATTCVSSFLIRRFDLYENEARNGSTDYFVPFIADHVITARYEHELEEWNYTNRWVDIFERLGSNDVVTGLWIYSSYFERHLQIPIKEAITLGKFWKYNHDLIRSNQVDAAFGGDAPSGLLWVSSLTMANDLQLLIEGESTEGVELRKNPLSLAVVKTWEHTLRTLAPFGARAILLTGGYHSDFIRSHRDRSVSP